MTRARIETVAAGGAYVVLDVHAPAGDVLPPHRHERATVTLHVLDGSLAVACGDERRVAGPGDTVTLPRGAPCRLEALTALHVVSLVVPGGVERLVGLAADLTPDPDDLAALLAGAGIALLPANWAAAA